MKGVNTIWRIFDEFSKSVTPLSLLALIREEGFAPSNQWAKDKTPQYFSFLLTEPTYYYAFKTQLKLFHRFSQCVPTHIYT